MTYGVRLKNPENGKWLWHRNKDGEINRFTKEKAEARASMWDDKTVAKAQKITARSK